jgi:hypothetical protein
MRPSPPILAALAALAFAAGGGVSPAAHSRVAQGQAAQSPAAQSQNVPGRCPNVTVSCPETNMLGAPAVFTVNVSGGDSKVNPSYRWEVSAGTIVSGQGTEMLTVDTTGLPLVGRQTLTATVEVGGFPADCPDTASCAVGVYVIIDYFPRDEYGDLRWSDEKARLDNFAIELRNNPAARGHVVCYGGRRGRRGEAERRCTRARDYLVTRRRFAPDRIVTVDGGYMERMTVVLWVLPPGADVTPNPTVAPGEVKFMNAPGRGKSPVARRRPRA